LIQAGAEINALNKNNVTALQLAISFGLPSVVAALIKAGAHHTKSKKTTQLLHSL
jgi:ankyrin repeat protein